MIPRKKLAILGSTGSVGSQCLDLISKNPELFEVCILMAGRNIDLLVSQIQRFSPKLVVLSHEDIYYDLKNRLIDQSISIELNPASLSLLFTKFEIDLVVNALPSIYGFRASVSSLEAGIDLALANKESLLLGGQLLMNLANKNECSIIPIDSEVSAISQCLQGENTNEIDRVYLTASGGPFYQSKIKQEEIKKEDVLNHPTWNMGPKISVDSASMMNKVYEIYEISLLFKIPIDQIDVLIHPQSKVHSMLAFKDGQIKALISETNMKFPLNYALSQERRHVENNHQSVFENSWNFEMIKKQEFSCFDLGLKYIKIGGSYPIALVVINDICVDYFLNGQIEFHEIPMRIKAIMSEIENKDLTSISEIEEYVKECKEICLKKLK